MINNMISASSMTPPNTHSATPLWIPSNERVENSNMLDFMRQATAINVASMSASNTLKSEISNYGELHQWSIEQPEAFWSLVWQTAGITPALPEGLSKSDILNAQGHFSEAQWFPNLQLNFAENLLQRRDEKAALISCGEPGLNDGQDRSISYGTLYSQVAKLAASLKVMGLEKGDRVAAFMPNTQETVVAMLATTSLGAIWSSCSPDFGLQGVIDRFGQIEAKILFTTDGYFYGGKTHNSLTKVAEIGEKLPSLEHVIVIPHVQLSPHSGLTIAELDLSALDALTPTVSVWHKVLDNPTELIEFVSVPFSHPLYIMYSSGTTGVPKCIVHSVGGTLLQHAKELRLHTDLKADDTIFYYSTCGWMMWNWLVSSLSTGATVVLYDGSPFYPSGHCLWQMSDRHNVSIFGTSAKYIAALEKAHIEPKQDYALAELKAVLSTGSPLAHESFDYVYRDIKADVCLSSISGGTDIISCFALGNPILPVYRGELQCPGLGMAVNIYDDQAKPLLQQKGELVCTQPFPSCPIGFWQDEGNNKFYKAYFDRFDNVWAQGDYGEVTANKGLIIHGRSDAVLNPGGVRIGTAEIYRQVEKLDQVIESIAIGQQWQDDVRVVLFVILAPNEKLDEALIQLIRSTIRTNTTPRHVPAKIIQVSDIPRTISGKIVELAVRTVVHNQRVKNTDALKNPEALNLFKNLPELQV
ncbi:MAG: acetoacetate--CoA ligase [Oleispira sp.]